MGKDLKQCFEFEREKKKLLGHENEPVLNKWRVDDSFKWVTPFRIHDESSTLPSNNFELGYSNVSCNWISSFEKNYSSRYQTRKFFARLGTNCKVSSIFGPIFRTTFVSLPVSIPVPFSVVHLVDFGLAKKYTSSSTGHEKDGITKV